MPAWSRAGLLLGSLTALFLWSAPAAVADDSFIAGYATAILEREFAGQKISVRVTDGVIVLQAKDIQGRERDKVVGALTRIAGVREVRIEEEPAQAPGPGAPPPKADQSSTGVTGGKWQAFPEGQLFSPLLADPRWPHFSIGYQHFTHSQVPKLGNVGSVTMGEHFNLVGYGSPEVGDFTLGVEPAVFAVFNMDAFSHDLVNADYRGALPLEYRRGPLALRASILHQSSHLGDEFLLDTPTQRINLSYEAVDVKISYQAGTFRFYAGGSTLVHREPETLKRWSAQQGVEWISTAHFINDAIAPIVAVDVQEHEETGWRGNLSLRAGIELVNPEKTRRRIQFLLEYYRGYNPNGQFYGERVEYFGAGMHVYF